MSDPEQLLIDARLVLAYCARTGLLPDDALAKSLAASDSAGKSPADPAYTSVATALNSAIKVMAPVTLFQLREGLGPFDVRGGRANNRGKLAICALAVLWVCLIAYYTQLLHREQTVVQTVQLIQDSHPLTKLNALMKMVKYDKVLSRNDAHLDAYNEQLDALQNLQEKASAFNSELAAVAQGTGFPFGDTAREWMHAMDSSVRAAPAAKASGLSPLASNAGSIPGPALLSDLNLPGSPPDACDPDQRNVAMAPFSRDPEWAWLKEVILNFSDLYCFSAKTNISAFGFNMQPTSLSIQQVQRRMTLQTGWILPALYGLLGASMFLMRDMLNAHSPPISAFAATVRIALGAMAGIIIGWFWVPTVVPGSNGAAFSSIPFGLAFLAGFSIDILYSLLDRVNKSVGDFGAQRPRA